MKPLAYRNDGDPRLEAWETLTPAQGESDYCTREGAQALKAMIEAYWRARGQVVIVALQNVGFHPAIRAARYDVRSDMINGMPRSVPSAKSDKPVQAEEFGEDSLAG